VHWLAHLPAVPRGNYICNKDAAAPMFIHQRHLALVYFVTTTWQASQSSCDLSFVLIFVLHVRVVVLKVVDLHYVLLVH
jgi:hypothetical protein